MLRLRRWRVARVHRQRKGGYDSPRTSYWTKAGARAAAIQLNMLHEVFGSRQGMLGAIQGAGGEHRWMPIRHWTLRGVQAHNIVMESGSYDRHPAGSRPLSARLNRKTAAPLRYSVAGVPTNLGPDCAVIGTGTCEEETSESTVPTPAEPTDAVGDLQGDAEHADVPRRPVLDQAGREPRRERDEPDADDVEYLQGT